MPSFVARSALASLAAACWLLAGCADRTAILIEVTSTDLTIPNDIDSLTIEVRTEFGVMFSDTYPVSTTWPHSLAITPPPLEAAGGVRIDVTGNLAGVPVTRRVASATWAPGTTRRVTVVLTRSCLNILCPDGYDCSNGECCLGLECAAPDAGMADGGTSDAGSDAGLDAPPIDASLDAPMSMDAGFDAGLDAGRDAGVDAGRDAGMDAGTDAGGDAGSVDAPRPAGTLIFSEYVEGSSNNKAVEILNLGATAADLSACRILVYSNGATAPSRTIPLSGSLAAGDVLVVCHASVGPTLAALCDMTAASPLDFNGDDAVELACATTIDVIGQIGFRPATEWGTGLTSTFDNTLRRRCSAGADSNGADVFDPALQWEGLAIDTFSGLGSPACSP